MKKKWLVAQYKTNEFKRVENNLLKQGFNFYLPKIKTKKNSIIKIELLFPGYIFIYTCPDNYSAIKYTKGIKNIIRFGENYPYISDEEINNIKVIEESSYLKPIMSKIRIGQEVMIGKGSLKGIIAKICSLPSKKRVGILLSFLGSSRRVLISEQDLIL